MICDLFQTNTSLWGPYSRSTAGKAEKEREECKQLVGDRVMGATGA